MHRSPAPAAITRASYGSRTEAPEAAKVGRQALEYYASPRLALPPPPRSRDSDPWEDAGLRTSTVTVHREEPITDLALLQQRDWLRVTLSSIDDAVVTADANGDITFLNVAAQSLTGWTLAEAAGVPLEAVFRIINEESRKPAENPAARALRGGDDRRAGQPQLAHRQGRDGAGRSRTLPPRSATIQATSSGSSWFPGLHRAPATPAGGAGGPLRPRLDQVNLVDSTYIDDAAAAHLNAADRLEPGSPIAGRVYFISQGEPWPVWDLINRILQAAQLPPVTRTIAPTLALLAGAVCETLAHALRLADEPPMTRFLARELSSAHWFDISAARRDLGYEPSVTIEEGMRRLEEALWRPRNACK